MGKVGERHVSIGPRLIFLPLKNIAAFCLDADPGDVSVNKVAQIDVIQRAALVYRTPAGIKDPLCRLCKAFAQGLNLMLQDLLSQGLMFSVKKAQ